MSATPEPPSPIEPERLAALRGRAASRLIGTAATKGAVASAADALSVLHALASSPETAADALTLLHELQVHQVELELQAQELRESRAELESALHRQIELYDFQPVGCFTIDARSVVHELNRTGAEMLGIGRDDACGLPLDAFFCADSALRFRAALTALTGRDTGPHTGPDIAARQTSCVVRLREKDAPQQAVASIGADPVANRYLVTLTPVVNDAAQSPGASRA